LRRVQFAFLCLGLLVLALIDCVLMLSHIMPNGAAWATRSDRIVWAILASFYLTSMTIAMYPGRTEA
jgi:hypothetical protein